MQRTTQVNPIVEIRSGRPIRIASPQQIAQADSQNLSFIHQAGRKPILFLSMWGGAPFDNYLFVILRPNAQSSLFARDSRELREKGAG